MPSFMRAGAVMRCSLLLLAWAVPIFAELPHAGKSAPDFSLQRLHGGMVQLSATFVKGPVVLVVLRGYPGYQCPLCNRQARDFLANAKSFATAGARVILVYPGHAEGLETHAREFADGKDFPDHFDLVLDPGYRFTDSYGLRWDAPGETAYPATFIINQQGIITYASVSKGHGGRTKAADIIERLRKL